MNPKYEKLLSLMAEYDAAVPGSPEKSILGGRLDKEGAGLSERDLAAIKVEYERRNPKTPNGILKT